MKKKPDHILKPNPGIKIDLKIKFVNVNNVVAILNFVNNAKTDIALYNNLCGIEGIKEDIIGMAIRDTDQPVKYIGKHQENYEGGKPDPLIYIFPKEGKDNFVLLKSNDSLKVEVNLAEAYNFKNIKGNLFALYSVVLPYVSPQDFKHIYEKDPKDHDKLKPVYFNLDSGDYTEFKIE